MTVTWNSENAAHLLRRAAFAAPPERIAEAVDAGLDATVATLLQPDPDDAALPKWVKNRASLQGWWVERMASSPAPLAEKLTLEWHNFFATAIKKVKRVSLMYRQNRSLRTYGTKNFEELLHALSKDPALLKWLNQVNSEKGNPNENLARELMELFSTGVFDRDGNPNYSEKDVAEAARALTGFTLKGDKFHFDSDMHDGGMKKLKGVAGYLDGNDVVDIVLGDHATHRRIAQKLWSWFAAPVDLDHPILDSLESKYRATGGDIPALLEAIFKSEAFYDGSIRHALVRSHAEFFAAALRLLGATIRPGAKSFARLGAAVERCGQALFDPETVFGWPGGATWLESSGLLGRARAAAWIADARQTDTSHPVVWDPAPLFGDPADWPTLATVDVVQRLLARLGPLDATPSTVAALVTYLETDSKGKPTTFALTPESMDGKVRGLVALALSCPEFQFA